MEELTTNAFFQLAKRLRKISKIDTMKKAEVLKGYVDHKNRYVDGVVHLDFALNLSNYRGQLLTAMTIDIHARGMPVEQIGMQSTFSGVNLQSHDKKLTFLPFAMNASLQQPPCCSNADIATQTSRLNTFILNGWPTDASTPYPLHLASAGFYYRKEGLEVHCFECKLKTDVSTWHSQERPDQAHARLSPQCSHVVSQCYKPMNNLTEGKVFPRKNDKKSTNDQTSLSQQPDSNAANDRSIRNLTNSIKKLSTMDEIAIDGNKVNMEITGVKSGEGTTVSNGLSDNFTEQRPTVTHDIESLDVMNSQLSQDCQQSFQPDFKYPQYQAITSRLRSYDTWIYGAKQSAESLSMAGYFYTGENDIVRCFCCDLGLAEWDPKDNPWIEHARHNPRCWFLKTQMGEFFIKSIQEDWKKIYNPKHVAFEDKVARIETFIGWRDDIEQTPELLADAGFFFTGEEDVVRCHYCDGGLRNWEPGDIPWNEHAKWFPFCKFVIKMKGRDFIEEIKRQAEEKETFERSDHNTNLRQGSAEEIQIIKELKALGLDDSSVDYGVTEYVRRNGHKNFSTDELMTIIFDRATEQSPQTKISFTGAAKGFATDNQEEKDPQRIREINKQLKEKMKCIRCRVSEISMLFVNCGHRITCENCADKMDFCPICDIRIKKRLKTFLS